MNVVLTDASPAVGGDSGEDHPSRAADHRVCQDDPWLHGPLTGRSDHAAQSR